MQFFFILISCFCFLKVSCDVLWAFTPNGTILNGIGINNYMLFYQINMGNSTQWLAAYFNGTFQNTNVNFPKIKRPFRIKSYLNKSILAYEQSSTNLLVSHYLIATSTASNITTSSYIRSASYGETQYSIIVILWNSIINKYQYNGTSFILIYQSYFNVLSLDPTSAICSSLYAYVGCSQGQIAILNITDLSYVSMVIEHTSQITSIIFNMNSSLLFSGDANGIVNGWRVGSQLSFLSNYTFHKSKIDSMLVTDNDFLIAKDDSGVISQLDLATWHILGSASDPGAYNYLAHRKTGSIFTFKYNVKFIQWNITTIQNSNFACSLEGCKTCQSTTQCLLCQYGYTIINKLCVGVCHDSNCLSCYQFGVLNSCGKCQDGYFLKSDGTCRLYYLTKQDLEYLSQTSIVTVSTNIFKTPLVRKAVTASSMAFLDLDELWIYQYHHRNYGTYLSVIFESIRLVEDQKWKMLGAISDNLDNGLESIMQNNTQYSSYKFVEVEGQQGGFLTNTLHFFVQSVPIITISFIVCRMIFNITRNYKFSIHFRNYSFLGFWVVLVMAGNLHYFIFLSINQCQMLFSFSFLNKLYLIAWALVFFLIVLYSASSFYIYKILYANLSKYFLDNQYRIMPSFLYSTIESFFRNFMLGFTHSYLASCYNQQIGGLIAIEVVSLGLLIYFWKVCDCFKLNGVTFLRCINYLLFILLDILLLLQQNFKAYLEVWEMLEDCLIITLIIIAINSATFTIYSLIEFLSCLWETEQEESSVADIQVASPHENVFSSKDLSVKGRHSKDTTNSHKKKHDANKTEILERNHQIEMVPKKSMLLIRNHAQKTYENSDLEEIVLQNSKKQQLKDTQLQKNKKSAIARQSKRQQHKNTNQSKNEIKLEEKARDLGIVLLYKQAFDTNKNNAFCDDGNKNEISKDI